MTEPLTLAQRLRADDLIYNRGLNYEPIRIPAGDLRKEAADRIEALEALKAEAMEVLRPFAAQSDKIHSGYDDGIAAGDHPMWHVFVSDLRAARRLYEKEEGR